MVPAAARAAAAALGVIGLKLPRARRRAGRRPAPAGARRWPTTSRRRCCAPGWSPTCKPSGVASETERLRSALLSSVSHDLRTPLAAIIGAAGSLDSYGDAMDEADRHSLLDTVRSEGERLDRYIQNLLDMTRLGHGGLALKRDWIGVDELIGSAIGAPAALPARHAQFEVDVAHELGPIWVHPALVEQALFNVLENAAKFSPPGEAVAVDARAGDRRQRCASTSATAARAFPRTSASASSTCSTASSAATAAASGTGLGLAICRGMIGAHGGEVEALAGQRWPRHDDPHHPAAASNRRRSRAMSEPTLRRPHRRAGARPGDRRRAADPQVPRHQPARAGLPRGAGGHRRRPAWTRWPRTARTWSILDLGLPDRDGQDGAAANCGSGRRCR